MLPSAESQHAQTTEPDALEQVMERGSLWSCCFMEVRFHCNTKELHMESEREVDVFGGARFGAL